MAGGSLGPTELILPTATSDPTGSEGSVYLKTDDRVIRVKTSDGWANVYEEPFNLSNYNPAAWWDTSTATSTSTVNPSAGSNAMNSSGTISVANFPNGTRGHRVSGGSHYTSSYTIPTGSNAKTLMLVFYQWSNTSGLQHALHAGSASTSQSYGLAWNGSEFSQHIWAGDGAILNNSNATSVINQTGNNGIGIFFSVYNGSTGTIRAYTNYSNWAAVASSANFGINTGSSYGLGIGVRVSGTENGDLTWGEVASWNSALNDTQMDEIAAGMKEKWVD